MRISATKPHTSVDCLASQSCERQPSLALFARTALEPDALVASVRKELTAIDRDIPIYGIRPMREYVSQRLEQPIPKVYVWQIHKG